MHILNYCDAIKMIVVVCPNSTKDTQQQLSVSKHMQKEAPFAMMNLYEYAMVVSAKNLNHNLNLQP